MQKSADPRECLAKVECGMAGMFEAMVLGDLVVKLVWEDKEIGGSTKQHCRHCGLPRELAHAKWCVAREII